MYKIECTGKFKTLKGVETPESIWESIGNAIGALGIEPATKAGLKPTKLIGWAQTMVQGGTLTLDKADFDSLRAFVGLLPNLTIAAIAQADDCFREAEKTKAE